MESPLRVCLLGLHFAPMMGGAERFAERQACQLQALGHQVRMVTLRHRRQWPQSEVRDDLAIVRIGGVYRRGGQLRIGRLAIWPIMPLVAHALWRLRAQYDVIYVMQVSPLAAVASLVGRVTKKPVIVCVATVEPTSEATSGRRADTDEPDDPAVRRSRRDNRGCLEGLRHSVVGGPLFVRYLERAPIVYHALSRRGIAYLTAKGIPAERITYVPNGIDLARFVPAGPWPTAMSGQYRDIACVARLEHNKGVDVLLHAWAQLRLRDTRDDASAQPRLLLIGDGGLQPRLEALARQLGIQESVVFVGRRDEIPELLQQCYAFVLPSRWEGLPNALLEAMACGLPCVATRVSGSEDVLTDEVNGLLVPPEQPDALSAALQRLLHDPNEAARLGRAARATIERSYALPAVVAQYVALYRRLTTEALSPAHH